MELEPARIQQFLDTLFSFYNERGRHDLPWRQTADPYHIVVSELMLQQTQVSRVIPKYQAFLQQFPDVAALAGARLGDVVIAWQGLGYNRRAQYLWRAAQQVQGNFQGRFPDTVNSLTTLPGIGRNTAGAIMAYAFNKPALFVETNIRSVIIHHFFKDHESISDVEILHLLQQLQEDAEPRNFYWAMMDYGTFIKQNLGNNVTRSRHYVRQSAFQGSRRQLRGLVIKSLATGPKPETDLHNLATDDRLPGVLRDLEQEGLIMRRNGNFELA